VNEPPLPPSTEPATPVVLTPAGTATEARGERRPALPWWIVSAVLALVAIAALVYGWRAEQRVRRVEQELVQRLQDAAGQANEARLVAKQAQDAARDAAAKVALTEARVAEVALQRSQLEELMQSLSRSRDENLLVDVEAAVRVAVQQSAITGSAEPLVAVLKQSDERLARVNQPRLEGVRRAIARDLDRVKAASVADISTLAIRLDEAIRMVDELPMLGNALARGDPGRGAAPAPAAAKAASTPASAAAHASFWNVNDEIGRVAARVWDEARALVRVTRVDHPDAVLLAPEQAFFVRENVKLRLLNARLAVLSRQFDTAQSDLQLALGAIERYFDRSARRTQLALDLVRQVAAQAKHGGVPRPDDTLAAITAATAGR
jgi:uroporphyrin-3 C-methyltransferase